MTTKYSIRIRDAAGQPARIYEIGNDLAAAIAQAGKMSHSGFKTGIVEVIDNTIKHPDHNILHTVTGW